MDEFVIVTDGGTAGSNPGIGLAAAIIKDGDGSVVHTEAEILGKGVSNNQAEYRALLLGIGAATRMGIGRATALCDSRLVVNQVNKSWAINSAALRELAREVRDGIGRFERFTLKWVPRDEVAEADALIQGIRPPTSKLENAKSSSLGEWLRKPSDLWFRLPDGRTLYKLTYYTHLADGTLPSIDAKIWRSLWDRNPGCWIVWRPWGKYPVAARQAGWGLEDLEDGVQQPVMAPIKLIRAEYLESEHTGKWCGPLLVLRSDAWEKVDESLAD